MHGRWASSGRLVETRSTTSFMAGVGLAMLAFGPASAASPDHCAVYAEAFAKHATVASLENVDADFVRDRLYHKCLNMDQEPALPAADVDPSAEEIGGSFDPDEEPIASILEDAAAESPSVNATAIDEAIVKQTAALEAEQSASARRSGQWTGSGYAMWSPEWRAWCAEHFPRSFDPKTGTVVPHKTGKREPCL